MDLLSRELIEAGSAGILLALFLGTFVSEDLACVTAGSLIATEMVDPALGVLACFTGIVVGDLFLFGFGRLFGRRLLDSTYASRFIKPRSVDRAAAWLEARGTSAVLISRFVSGLRLPTYFLSGLLRLDPKRFTLLVTLGAAIWTPIIVLASALWNTTVPFGTIMGIVLFFVLFSFGFRLTDNRRRRLFTGKIKRIWKWEFWPLWLFYAPVLAYVMLVAIRYRGLHFTAANPAMPAGGFVGESKDAIYELIAKSPKSSRHLLRHLRLQVSNDAEKRLREAAKFIRDNCLSFPVVVKPDAGERGNGVTIVYNDADLAAALNPASCDLLVQEFMDGVEVSVFYYRFPNEPGGHVFSMTEKIFPSVIGDGVSSLEDLILGDDRAHIIAPIYFDRHAKRLQSVPPAGQVLPLVNIGSHSKGAIFRDGGWLKTRALENAIDSLASSIPGFYFGRFDLRATSFDELQNGQFYIIELNGVTSESTNIYDPKISLFDAYRILFRQWRIAFFVGSQNVARGCDKSTISDLAMLYLKSRRITSQPLG